jgi:hypothetical protein
MRIRDMQLRDSWHEAEGTTSMASNVLCSAQAVCGVIDCVAHQRTAGIDAFALDDAALHPLISECRVFKSERICAVYK